MMVLSTNDRRIKYLSYCYYGSTHDFTLLKTELPPEEGQWFKHNKVHVDLGYQGIAKQYQCAKLFIPMKKPPGGELSKKQKKQNRKKSRKRIVVENAIGGMKRYRFLSDRARCHSIPLYNKIAGIAAGLWNYNVTTR
jgi:hypothetical protein